VRTLAGIWDITMKRVLFSTIILSAVLATGSAFADDTIHADQPAASATTQQVPYAALTRAEVKAELARARRAGDLQPINALDYPQLLPYQAAHAEQAASVRAMSNNTGTGATVSQ
jgi:Domain of unknown function (DUF4148)